MPTLQAFLLLSLLASAIQGFATGAAQADVVGKPNIVLILTDDQDVGTLQRRFLPKIFNRLVDEGALFDNFFAPVSICCPSRVSLLRAQYAHNHNITFVSRPWGGWEIFNEHNYTGHTLPDFMQQAGYSTWYTGKLMNGHTVENCERLPVSGFNSSDFLVDPYTYDYWNPAFSRDNGPAIIHSNIYSTDLVKQKALDYLTEASKGDQPFFLTIAPIGPHSWVHSNGDPKEGHLTMDIPAAASRHANLFHNERIPRAESFNPDHPSGVSWVKHLPKAVSPCYRRQNAAYASAIKNETVEAYWDEFYRGRLRALQAVDELVDEVFERLEHLGQIDNTFVIYTSDNGFAIGSHRRQPGKTLGFEQDIHVPLIIRGPGVLSGSRDSISSWGMVDLAKTIMGIAGARADYTDDGRQIVLPRKASADDAGLRALGSYKANHAISEFWVLGVEEGKYAGPYKLNNTYRTVRAQYQSDGDNQVASYSYSVWCTGERELYDLINDPEQLRNLLAPLNALGSFMPFDSDLADRGALKKTTIRLLDRLDALMLVLKTCTGDACVDPYSKLLPSHSRRLANPGFADLLDPALDEYFAQLPKVAFKACDLGYHRALEQPEWEQTSAPVGKGEEKAQIVFRQERFRV